MRTTILVIIAASLLATVLPLAAHHAFSAEYDLSKPMYMDGKVTKVEWMNPHVYVYIDVADKSNGAFQWTVEISPPNALTRNGWDKNTFRAGMNICVEGFPEKSGMPKFGSTSITMKESGKVMQTPPGNWMGDALPVNNLPPTPIVYTGKTSCSNR
jgi:hypothetical protein